MVKPAIPRRLQLSLRRKVIALQRIKYADIWPIDEQAAGKPENWKGWPEKKDFALILTHDVDTARGQERCLKLAELEERLGFRSSFNFVPERYKVSGDLLRRLKERGFEIGVHGLYHDGNYFQSRDDFRTRAVKINRYLKKWGAVGYRSPCMEYDLDWFHDIDMLYDSSTFDTDPFEPLPVGQRTIFPFCVTKDDGRTGYVELPYTLPQDFTLFVMMREKNIDIWKKKVDWVVEHGGMVLVNVHPDYLCPDGMSPSCEEYPIAFYEDLLSYIKLTYDGRFWHALPRDVAGFWLERCGCVAHSAGC